MRGMLAAAAVLIGIVNSDSVRGDIVYDAITTNSWHGSIYSEYEYAEDTRLSTGVGTIVRQVEVGINKSGVFPGAYSGTMTVNLWSDAGGIPGTLLASSEVPVFLPDTSPRILVASFGGVAVPTQTIWTAVKLSFTTQIAAGIMEGHGMPSVGTSTDLRAQRINNQWALFAVAGHSEFIRINTVPGPWGAGVIVGGIVAWGRRGQR